MDNLGVDMSWPAIAGGHNMYVQHEIYKTTATNFNIRLIGLQTDNGSYAVAQTIDVIDITALETMVGKTLTAAQVASYIGYRTTYGVASTGTRDYVSGSITIYAN